MKSIQRKIVGLFSALAVTSVGAAFAYHNFVPHAPASAASAAEPTLKLHPNGSEIVVRAFTVERPSDGLGTSHAFTGTLQPRYQASVGFRVAGKISERLVETGQRVVKGQTLFRLDPEDSDLMLRVAEADLVSAQSSFKQTSAEEMRLLKLRSSGAVSQSDYDLALAARDVAESRVETALRRLDIARNQRTYCDLVADSDGLVTSVLAEAGQVVNVGQAVLLLMQSDELEVAVSLPESTVANAKNWNATATFWSRPNMSLEAQLRELSPMADAMSRTFDARFKLLAPSQDLAIGMTATIHLSDVTLDGFAVPLASVAKVGDESVVWRIETETANVEAVPVELVEYRSDMAIVRGSLQPNDSIVSAGVQRIDAHSKVRIWNSK